MSENRGNSRSYRGIIGELGPFARGKPWCPQPSLIHADDPNHTATEKRQGEEESSALERRRKSTRNRLIFLIVAGVAGITAIGVGASAIKKSIRKAMDSDIQIPDKDKKNGTKESAKSKFPTKHLDEEVAAIDEEIEDHSYDNTQEVEIDTPDKQPRRNRERSLLRKQALNMATKMVREGNLMSRFLSKPKREKWTETLVNEMAATGITLNRQNLIIAIVTVDRESGFHEIGIVNDPERVLDRKIAEFKKENPHIYDLMEDDVAHLRARALQFIQDRREANRANGISRNRSDGSKVGYFTERDIDLAIDYAMELYDSVLPSAVKKLISKESLNKYRPKTLGCMQIDIRKAINLAKRFEGKNYSEHEMRDILNTRKGGMHYSMLYLKEILDSHQQETGEMTPDTIKQVFLDFNMGAFSTRNAAIQSNLNRLGANISVDGDLLRYDENGRALGNRSDTMRAIWDIFNKRGETLSYLQIKQDLLKEKSAAFELTTTYLRLRKLFKSQGLTARNSIPSGEAKGGFVKFGTHKITGRGYVNGSYRRYRDLERIK